MTAQVLRKAADLIEERGWCQGSFHRLDGSLCLEGALMTAMFGKVDVDACFDDLGFGYTVDAIWEWLADDPQAWNDTPGRTAVEVVAALRACADEVDQ